MNDELLKHFLALQAALEERGVSIVLGGGMSLYVNLTFRNNDTRRYPFEIKVRPTNDLDIYLSADILADGKKYEIIKATLEQVLNYNVVSNAKWFQFEKEIELFGAKRTIKVDLLSAPPNDSDLNRVAIKAHRVKPKSVEGIHAYLTKEAKGLEFGKQIIPIPGSDTSITIVSNFNYLIFKLYAFADRTEDEKKDYGRHHALDIFYTVARMGEGDWENARAHFQQHSNEEYLIRASEIRKTMFGSLEHIGLIRMAENQVFKSNYAEFSSYREQFLKDIEDLFQPQTD